MAEITIEGVLFEGTPKELTEIFERVLERKQAEKEIEAKVNTKWAKIGRKPNEFKKGDIVRVMPNNYWFDNSDYIYGVVDHLSESGNPSVVGRVKDGRIISLYIEVNEVELIAPVESRFDEVE
jgi:hypothetical protein